MDKNRIYMCIDLKSFYASVECVLRGLNPLDTNLVVADTSRTEKTICLAVSPSLKAYGIPGRARLFEVVQAAKKINYERARVVNNYFIGSSVFASELKANPNLELNYIAATPQMAKYISYSSKIYDIYLRHIMASDIHVYSIDEVFMDVTDYLPALKITPFELAKRIIREILLETGITATAGIGTNMYLAKVAMDIVAKHKAPDEYGARMAYLDEESYRKLLWSHKPITDFWRVGAGYQRRLKKHGIETMGDIALMSISDDSYYNENLLYKEFGINAELLIDHAWGYEPTTMADIKSYKPVSNSLSTGQVLHCAYTYEKTKLILKEMTDLLALDLVKKGLVTKQLSLAIGYDIDNLEDAGIADKYHGEICLDYYGRQIPKSDGGTVNLDRYTSSGKLLTDAVLYIFEARANPILSVRRINISANGVIKATDMPKYNGFNNVDIFTDYEEFAKKEEEENIRLEKEQKLQKTIIKIKERYGKNAALKGMNLEDGGTTIDRNKQIGGHKA